MAIQLSVNFHGNHLTYDVESSQEEVYILRMCEHSKNAQTTELPQKMVIRRKGKLWISDAENYTELVSSLKEEIRGFSPDSII
jgi:hypothetical protein